MNQYQLMKEVKTITNQDNYERCEALKRMGKDPRKMTKIN
jgi:hypothetical protein